MPRKWTATEVEDVCAKFGKMSASQIGNEYGVSKSAITGLWSRIRANGSKITVRSVRAINAENVKGGQGDAVRVAALRADVAPIVCEGVAVRDHEEGQCRYVIGRGSDGLSRYCGAFTGFPGSWCPDHRKRVFASDQRAAARALSVAY